MRWLTKFNHIIPMLPKASRIAYLNQNSTPNKDKTDNSGLLDHHPVNDFVGQVNLRDEWLIQSPGPWDPAKWSGDWPWQQ
jgi:hypothetical protein